MPPKPTGKKSSGAESNTAQSRKGSKMASWSLPPLAWMLAAAQGSDWKLPERMLVCGAIPEIGSLAKALPECEIIVLEASEAQARTLRTACSRSRLKNTRVQIGSPDEEALPELVGSNFDLILALGVLSGSQHVERAMENLSTCTAAKRGGVYLELDTASHPASRLAEIQSLHPAGKDAETAATLARVAAGVCGLRPTLPADNPTTSARCWPLLKWLGLAAGSGLRPAASTLPPRLLPPALPFGGMSLFSGLDLVSLCCLLEDMAAPPVLQVLFTRRPLLEPPWANPAALSEWRPSVQFWPRDKVPAMEPPLSNFIEIGIDIPGILALQKFQITAYLLEFLRVSDGKTPVSQIMASLPHPAKIEEIIQALYFFHHTCIIRLLPPD